MYAYMYAYARAFGHNACVCNCVKKFMSIAHTLQPLASVAACVLLVPMVPTWWREEWSTVAMDYGVLCLMMALTPKMEKWYVGDWDISTQVRNCEHATQLYHIAWVIFYAIHTGVHVFWSSYYGQGIGPIVFDALRCDGTESKLEDCRFSTTSYYDSHSEDIGLHCYERGRL